MKEVYLTSSAEKDLRYISKNNLSKIKRKILSLEQQPLSGKNLTGKLQRFFSLRAWPYRIIYFIERNKVIVTHIMHRKDVYKKIK